MKRTPIKKTQYSLKRSPLRATAKALRDKTYKLPQHSKNWKPIPKEVLKIVCVRDGGAWNEEFDVAVPPKQCIYCGQLPNYRGFQFVHREAKAMGGRFNKEWERINNDPQNQCYIPAICHDRIDGRDFKELDNIEMHRLKHGCKPKI